MKINIKKLNKVMLIASVLFGFSKMSLAGDVESGSMPVTSDLKVKLSDIFRVVIGIRTILKGMIKMFLPTESLLLSLMMRRYLLIYPTKLMM